MRRALVTVGVTLSVAGLLLTGCAGSESAATKATESETTESSIELPDGLVSNGEVTDELGTYTATKLDPNSPLYTLDESIVDMASLEQQGFTLEDAKSAQKYVLDFISTEGGDSIAVDSPAGWEKWKNDISKKYLLEEVASDIISDKNGATSDVIYNKSIVPLIRDGKSRIVNENIAVAKIDAFSEAGHNVIKFEGTQTVQYRASEKDVIKYISSHDASYTEEVIKNQFPSLFDGKEERIQAVIDWTYAVVKDENGQWKIGGYFQSAKTTIVGVNDK